MGYSSMKVLVHTEREHTVLVSANNTQSVPPPIAVAVGHPHDPHQTVTLNLEPGEARMIACALLEAAAIVADPNSPRNLFESSLKAKG